MGIELLMVLVVYLLHLIVDAWPWPAIAAGLGAVALVWGLYLTRGLAK